MGNWNNVLYNDIWRATVLRIKRKGPDKEKPNGTMRKVLDVSLAKRHGWKFKTPLKKGLAITINDYLKKNLS